MELRMTYLYDAVHDTSPCPLPGTSCTSEAQQAGKDTLSTKTTYAMEPASLRSRKS
jgi:hypothetical protein